MSRSALRFINNPATHELSGPDFLLAVAAAEESIGNQVNAEEYRRRAGQWQRDIDAASGKPAVDQPAANSEWPAHLPRLVRASDLIEQRRYESAEICKSLPAHHFTPSDHR